LTSTQTSFSSTGAGQNIVTIAAPATVSIAAGTATNNELIYNSTAPASLTGTGGSISGFSIYGYGASASGVVNMANIPAAFTAIDVVAAQTATSQGFTNVVPGTRLFIDGFPAITNATGVATGSNSVTYTTTGTTGASNSLSLTLGFAPTATSSVSNGFTTNSLTLQDANTTQAVANGIGTLNVSSNASNIGQAHTITTLNDSSLSALNITGNAGLIIGTIGNDVATSLTINDTHTGTGVSRFGTTAFTDASLTAITLTGTGAINSAAVANSTFGTITLNNATTGVGQSNFTITNNNTSSVGGSTAAASGYTINTLNDANLSSLTLLGSQPVSIGTISGDTSTLLSITNNSGNAAVTSFIDTLSDTNLTSLSFAGTGNTTITSLTATSAATTLVIQDTNTGTTTIPTLVDNAATSEVITTAATGTLTIGGTMSGTTLTAVTHTGAALTSVTLSGNINYQANAMAGAAIVVNAGSDNSTVNLTVTNTNNSNSLTANSFTLGNGNNTINLGAHNANTVRATVSVGTGVDTVILGQGGYTVTYGTHSSAIADTLTLGTAAQVINTTPALITVNGWNLSNSSTSGDKMNFTIAAFTTTNTLFGMTTAGGANSAVTAGTTPVLANFPVAVGGNMPVGNIFSFGSTVYNAASLQTYIQTQQPILTSPGSTNASFLALATYSDGVHVELIRLLAAGSLVGATVTDYIDLVGTSMTNVITSINANGFGFI